jgi:hypothetical protein
MMRKKWLPHFIAIVSLVVFIFLGLASDGGASTPPSYSSSGGGGGSSNGCRGPLGYGGGGCLVNDRNRLVCGMSGCAAVKAANSGNTQSTTTCDCY